MDQLRARLSYALMAGFLVLLGVDVADDLLLGDRWVGCPREVYPLIGALIAGVFTVEALRRRNGGNGNGNGNGKSKPPYVRPGGFGGASDAT